MAGHSVHTKPQHLERWLGRECVDNLSRSMRDWYGPPIALQGVPGFVYACPGGDFKGRIEAGVEVSALEVAEDKVRRELRTRRLVQNIRHKQAGMAGFSDLADLVAEGTKASGKRHELPFRKVGTASQIIGQSKSLWQIGPWPESGVQPGNPPSGTAHVKTNAGAFKFTGPGDSSTLHFIAGEALATVANNTLLLYDRLFSTSKTGGTTAAESITGVPTRYQSTTASDPEYIGGNFLFVECMLQALPATAHNWTVCTYTDQAGAASTLPSLTGRANCPIGGFDHPTFQWFAPLASGDNGIQTLTQLQCSAVLASGVVFFTIGHPIAFIPCPVADFVCVADGLFTAFNLARILDNACLALIETPKPATTLTTYTGKFTAVYG